MMTQIERMRLLTSIIAKLEREHDGVAPLPEVKGIAEGKGIGEEFVDEFIRRGKARELKFQKGFGIQGKRDFRPLSFKYTLGDPRDLTM